MSEVTDVRPVPHGTVQGYRSPSNCRCDACKAAKAAYAKAERARSQERIKATKARYYAENREKVLAAGAAWRAEHREHSREYQARKKATDPDYRARALQYGRESYYRNREAVIARQKVYAAQNRDAVNRKAREYRERHPDRVRETLARWSAAHPEKVVETSAIRRARRRKNETCKVLPRDWQRMCARYRWCCAYCGQRRKLTQDHVIPISRGGRHAIGNLLPACRSCNSRKRHRLIVEWRRELGEPLRFAS